MEKIKDAVESVDFTPESIRDYIISKISDECTFLFNELDLQMFVARALADKFKDGYKIHLEYRLPKKWNKEFDEDYKRWGETPYFDIVLEKTGENTGYIPIELKYKLKAVKLNKDADFTRFGKQSSEFGVTLVTNQSAENEGRYDFWKDVKRIELLTRHFSAVKGGIALFLTNQPSYKINNDGNKCSNFNLNDIKNGFLYWCYATPTCGKGKCCVECEDVPCGEQLKKKKSNWDEAKHGEWGTKWDHYLRPNFRLDGEYQGKWSEGINMKIGNNGKQNETFYCYSVVVPLKQSSIS